MKDRAPDWVARGTPEPLRSELCASLGADRLLTRALELVMYASDASPYRMIPQAIAMPRSVDDVVKLFAFARGRQVIFDQISEALDRWSAARSTPTPT